MISPPIIEAVNITKKYGPVIAVDKLSLAVPQGMCFGLLGPNGAGKTTLIEIIEDIIPATSGEVRFEGNPISANFREKIGIMFQQTSLLLFMTVEETLVAFESLYHDTQPIEELIRLCHLDDIRRQLNDKISGGQRQRLLLALALINQPDLLFLDEPSTGLDPQARHNLWDIIRAIKAQNKSIILTTHYMDEAQALCDRIAIMDHGQIIAQGTSRELIEAHTQGTIMSFPGECFKNRDIDLPFERIASNDRMMIQVGDINETMQHLLSIGIDLSRMRIETPNLETVFLNLTGRRLRE
jgi:ABC-2 type transport system ATP-binding protein